MTPPNETPKEKGPKTAVSEPSPDHSSARIIVAEADNCNTEQTENGEAVTSLDQFLTTATDEAVAEFIEAGHEELPAEEPPLRVSELPALSQGMLLDGRAYGPSGARVRRVYLRAEGDHGRADKAVVTTLARLNRRRLLRPNGLLIAFHDDGTLLLGIDLEDRDELARYQSQIDSIGWSLSLKVCVVSLGHPTLPIIEALRLGVYYPNEGSAAP